jgi:hypothetical protein
MQFVEERYGLLCPHLPPSALPREDFRHLKVGANRIQEREVFQAQDRMYQISGKTWLRVDIAEGLGFCGCGKSSLELFGNKVQKVGSGIFGCRIQAERVKISMR